MDLLPASRLRSRARHRLLVFGACKQADYKQVGCKQVGCKQEDCKQGLASILSSC